MSVCVCVSVCFVWNQAGQNRSIQGIYGVDLSDSAKAILRRNCGIHAAKEIRECREAKLDLSHRKLGDEGVAELVPELKVIPFEVLLATAWMFLLDTHLPTYLPPTPPTYLLTYRSFKYAIQLVYNFFLGSI